MAKKVMIVDDSLFMRKMLRDITEAEGYVVVAEAADADEAVAKYKEHRPDVTTMDIVMGARNGIEALRDIKDFNPSAIVVMCSAIGEESYTTAATDAGAKGFILKPFSREAVAKTLKAALRG